MNKKRKRKEAPPLSSLDKRIYIALIMIFLLLTLALVPDWSYWGARAFGIWIQPAAMRREASDFIAMWLLLAVLLVCTITLYIKGFIERNPIFGDKTIAYGEYPWPKNLYPIFDRRRKTHRINVENRRFWRCYVTIMCLILIFVFIISGPVICRRICFEDNGDVNAYNSLAPISRYNVDDYERAEFEIYKHTHRFNSYWSYELTVVCSDGRSYSFAREDMKEPAKALETVLRIKNMLPEKSFMRFHYQFMETLISEENIRGAEEAMLRQIFE